MSPSKLILLILSGFALLLFIGVIVQMFGSAGILIILLLGGLAIVWFSRKLVEYNKALQNAKLVEADLAAELKGRFESLHRLEIYLEKYYRESSGVIKMITDARQRFASTARIEDQWSSYQAVYKTINENYPSFSLQDQQHSQLNQILKEWTGNINILNARKAYNLATSSYNEHVSVFPISLFAPFLGYSQLNLIVASNEEKGMPPIGLKIDN